MFTYVCLLFVTLTKHMGIEPTRFGIWHNLLIINNMRGFSTFFGSGSVQRYGVYLQPWHFGDCPLGFSVKLCGFLWIPFFFVLGGLGHRSVMRLWIWCSGIKRGWFKTWLLQEKHVQPVPSDAFGALPRMSMNLPSMKHGNLENHEVPLQWWSGWWFGTWILFFHSVGNNHPNWLSYFLEGLKPPTSDLLQWCGEQRWFIHQSIHQSMIHS